MRLTINFGLSTKREVHWYRDLMDFPNLLRFQGAKWEWAFYNGSGSEYELTYSQLATYDPNYYADMPSFEELFNSNQVDKCECGAIFSSFSWDHMRYCKKHKPWGQI